MLKGVLTALCLLFAGQQTLAASSSPNIVLVFVDDQGNSDISYNDDSIITPHLEAISGAGVRLTNFYSGATCTPSRAMLMTGKYALHIGMQDSVIHSTEPRGVPLTETFVSEKLQASGYNTVAIGKWHLGMHNPNYLPLDRGFDYHFGIYTGGGSHTKHLSVSQSFTPRSQEESFVYSGENLWENGEVSEMNHDPTHSTVQYTNYAVDMVHKLAEEDDPFFIYLAYQAIHDPMEVATQQSIDQTDCSKITDSARQLVCGMMYEIDTGVGKIKDALIREDIWDNTLFIYSSDNGGVESHGSSNAPFRDGKGTYWEGGVRVPAFIGGGYLESSLPGTKEQKNHEYSGLFHLVDLHALMLRVADYDDSLLSSSSRRLLDGAPVNTHSIRQSKRIRSAELASVPTKTLATREFSGIDGMDMWALLVNDNTASAARARDEVLINANSDTFGGSAALVMGDYKYMINGDPKEATIYTHVRKYIAGLEQELAVSTEDLMEYAQAKANKILTGKEYLFNIKKNVNETVHGSCDDEEACSNLIGNKDFAKIKNEMTSRLEQLKATAVDSTFSWQDDGVLANPQNFEGVWQAWRDRSNEPLAIYLGSHRDVLQDGTRPQSLSEESSSSKSSSSKSLVSANSMFSNLPDLAVLGVSLLVAVVSYQVGVRRGQSSSTYQAL